MKRIKIKVTLEQEIYLTKEAWEDFGEELPQDFEDLDMLKDEALAIDSELLSAELVTDKCKVCGGDYPNKEHCMCETCCEKHFDKLG